MKNLNAYEERDPGDVVVPKTRKLWKSTILSASVGALSAAVGAGIELLYVNHRLNDAMGNIVYEEICSGISAPDASDAYLDNCASILKREMSPKEAHEFRSKMLEQKELRGSQELRRPQPSRPVQPQRLQKRELVNRAI